MRVKPNGKAVETPLMGLDVFMRHTAKDGSAYVMHHRVWNRAVFLAVRADEAAKAGGSCQQITQDQYQTEKER